MKVYMLELDPRCRQVRRDLADPYQMHSSLCRAFSSTDQVCPPNQFLWRLEPESSHAFKAKLIVQGRVDAQWEKLPWSKGAHRIVGPGVGLGEKAESWMRESGVRWRFRLRANPCMMKEGRRRGLLSTLEQEAWLKRKGERHGFSIDSVITSQAMMLRGQRRQEAGIQIFSVLFDGYLRVMNPAEFVRAMECGVGHGKVLGLGLLSVVPVR